MPRVPVREHAPRDFLRQIRREEPREIARRRPRSRHFTARDLRPEPEHLLGRPVCESVRRGPTKNIAFCPVGDKSVHSFHEPPARRTSATRALTVATFAAMWNRLSSLRGRPCIVTTSASHCCRTVSADALSETLSREAPARSNATTLAKVPGSCGSMSAPPTYIRRIDAAGGWKKYECRHRKQLTMTFARVVFPRLPIEAISNIVCFWAHVGFYAVA